jgi:hypothetical protein
MKSFFVVTLLLFVAGHAIAQWNPNNQTTGSIYYNGGNVGIGTTSPSFFLDVRGPANSNVAFFGNDLSQVNSPFPSQVSVWGTGINSESRIGFGTTLPGGTTGHTAMIKSVVPSNGGGHLVFQTREPNYNSLVERLLITNSGNIGIGTLSPTSKLDVNTNGRVGLNVSGNTSAFVGSDINISRVSTTSSVGQGATMQFNDTGTASYNVIQGSSDGLQIFNNYANSGWLERMRISGNGNVGIGTTNPQTKLDINGSGIVGLNVSGNSSSFLGADMNISRINTTTGVGRGATLQFNDTGSSSYNVIQGSEGGLQIFNNYANAGWVERMRVAGNGNVGIGTTNPDAKLAVKGTVHAEEVKVDLQVPGPDYVFEPTYQLPSLTEIETYIKANKHLPEVPSAKEMEANGINLSEMNMLLLKKVEELTLYMIEMKSEFEQLKSKNEFQDTKIKALEAKDKIK